MDIRCSSCSKLFRVADEKIAGKGIRFKCSRCAETITVTKEDFEREKASREAAVAATGEPVPPAPSAPAAAIAQEPPPQEYQAQEYKPPTVPAGVDDFNLGETQEETPAGQEDMGVGGGFPFGETAGEERDEGQEATPEISLSESEAQEAEAAFQFPTDIISEPKPLPVSKTAPAAELSAKSEEIDLGAALAMPQTAPSEELPITAPVLPESEQAPAEEEIDLGAALAVPKTPVVETPKPTPAGPVFSAAAFKAAAAAQEAAIKEEEMDLGAALAMPKAASEAVAEGEAAEGAGEAATGAAEAYGGEGINPFTSGNLTGAIAGFVCTMPALYFLTLGFGKLAALFPVVTVLPSWYLLTVSSAGILGLGIVLGIITAVLQAQTGKSFFFLVNILVGTLFGAVMGSAMSVIISLAAGGGFDLGRLQADATLWAGASFAVSSVLALARWTVLRTREETFAAELTVTAKAGLGLSALVMLAALYGMGTFAGQMEHAQQALAKQRQETMKKQVSIITPEGLAVVNGVAYLDPAIGDLVMTGEIQNLLDRPKEGWYLEADVLDAGQKVLATVRVLDGVQLLSPQDRAVLAKRSVNVDALREKMAQASRPKVPARGSVAFEARLYEPPPAAASFLPRLKRFEVPSKATKTQP